MRWKYESMDLWFDLRTQKLSEVLQDPRANGAGDEHQRMSGRGPRAKGARDAVRGCRGRAPGAGGGGDARPRASGKGPGGGGGGEVRPRGRASAGVGKGPRWRATASAGIGERAPGAGGRGEHVQGVLESMIAGLTCRRNRIPLCGSVASLYCFFSK
jgi:hypothetical protein